MRWYTTSFLKNKVRKLYILIYYIMSLCGCVGVWACVCEVAPRIKMNYAGIPTRKKRFYNTLQIVFRLINLSSTTQNNIVIYLSS